MWLITKYALLQKIAVHCSFSVDLANRGIKRTSYMMCHVSKARLNSTELTVCERDSESERACVCSVRECVCGVCERVCLWCVRVCLRV